MLSNQERLISCWLLLVAIVAGFTIPGLSEAFAPYTTTSLLLLIIMSLLPMGRMKTHEVFTPDSKVWQIVVWQLLILPAIIVSAAHLARIDASFTKLMITTASAGSLFASPTFAELLQVNRQKALQCMVLSTFLMPLSYFVFFTLVLHAEVSFDLAYYVYNSLILLVIPLGIFLIYMGLADDLPTKVADSIDFVSRRATILALIVFGLGIVGPARDLMWQDHNRFLLYLLTVTLLGVGMAYLTAVVMFRQGLSDSLSASIVSGFRNVGLGSALLAEMAGNTTSEYVGVSQIPIFLAPLAISLFTKRKSFPKAEAMHLNEPALFAQT